MATVKQGKSDWQDNDGEMTSHRKSTLSASKRPWGGDRCYFVNNH